MVSKSKFVRRGLTLVEILIALVMTLIVLGAMMFSFRAASTQIARGRSVMELSNNLRTAENLLRSDTDGVTVDTRPWSRTASPNGYFELVEGPLNDTSNAANAEAILGDVDDILAMTVRSGDRPFRGRFNGDIVESDIAEVIWWTSVEDSDGDGALGGYDDTITLHRRVLLIRPDLNAASAGASSALEFFLANDISARSVGGQIISNSLADLARRENRFARMVNAPFDINRTLLGEFQLSSENLASVAGSDPELPARAGDDIVLTDVLGFDLQVYSPDTPILVQDGLATEPDDLGYSGGALAGQGAYIDLAIGGAGQFSEPPTLAIGGQLSGVVSYDTFSTHYETDGFGTDGIDNNGVNGVDDNAERVSSPPYPHVLRGMKATLRAVERKSKQVRQLEVISSFVPQ